MNREYKPGTIRTQRVGEQLCLLSIGSIFRKNGKKYEVTHTSVSNSNSRRYRHSGKYAVDLTESSYGYAREIGTTSEINMTWGHTEEKDIIYYEIR